MSAARAVLSLADVPVGRADGGGVLHAAGHTAGGDVPAGKHLTYHI